MSEGLLSAAPVSLANPGLVYSHVEITVFLCKHENLPVWIGLQDWGLRPSGQIEKSLFKRLPVIWNQSGALLRSGITVFRKCFIEIYRSVLVAMVFSYKSSY